MTQIEDRTAADPLQASADYVNLRRALVALLFRHDPIQVSYETNLEEYAPEAGNILARLSSCYNVGDVCVAVYQELVRSFGTEAVGSIDECEEIAAEAWELFQRCSVIGK